MVGGYVLIRGFESYDATNTIVKTIFIDTTQNPVVITTYAGPNDMVRQVESSEGTRLNNILESMHYIIRFNPASTATSIPSLRLQSDNQTLAGAAPPPFISSGGGTFWVLTRLDGAPPIRPYSAQDRAFPGNQSYSDVSDPKFMFDEFCDYLLTEEPMSNLGLGFFSIRLSGIPWSSTETKDYWYHIWPYSNRSSSANS